jgi:hypothetical protein
LCVIIATHKKFTTTVKIMIFTDAFSNKGLYLKQQAASSKQQAASSKQQAASSKQQA